jgi:predicted DNA-binding transcriptional regulator AlpA
VDHQIQLLSPNKVAELLGISRVTLWRMRQEDDTFPSPYQITERRIGFLKSEIEAWVMSRRAS